MALKRVLAAALGASAYDALCLESALAEDARLFTAAAEAAFPRQVRRL